MLLAALAAAGLTVPAGAAEPSGVAPSHPTEASSPRSVGLDAALLEQTLQEAAALPRLDSLIIAREGEPLVERVFRGPGLDAPANIKSASKAVLSALVGIAIERGVLDGLDQPVAPILGDRVPADADPRVWEITVGDLLSMRAGLERTSGRNYGAWVASPDWVRYALSRPFVADPGGRMLYSTGSSHLISAALTVASGRSTLALARDWLGEPLGIAIPPWPRDPQGVYFGGNDMSLSPRALLRFGELFRNGGVHEGRRILSEDWIRTSWTPQVRSPWSGFSYGYGWWIKQVRGHAVAFAWGYGGQLVFVVPDLGLTVVMTSDPTPSSERHEHLDALHGLLDHGIIPAAERGEGGPASPSETL